MRKSDLLTLFLKSVASIFLVKAISGLAREATLAHTFGTSWKVDYFQAMFNWGTYFAISVGSTLPMVMVPLYSRCLGGKKNDDTKLGSEFGRREISKLEVIAGLVSIASIFLFFLWSDTASRLDFMSMAVMSLSYGLASFFIVKSADYSSYLVSRNSQVPILIDAVPAIFLAISIYALQKVTRFLLAISMAVLFAYVLQYLIYFTYTSAISSGKKIVIGISEGNTDNRTHWRIWVLFVTNLIMGFGIILDVYYAGKLGHGALAVFLYASKLVLMFMAAGALLINRILLPYFSSFVAFGDVKRANCIAAIVFLSGILVILIYKMLASDIISILYGHGAFTMTDAQAVTDLSILGFLQLPVYLSGMVYVNYLSAHGKYLLISVVAVINIIIKNAVYITLGNEVGVSVSVYSNIIMYAGSFVLLATFCNFKKKAYI